MTARAAPNDEVADDRDVEMRDNDAMELAAPQAAPAPGRRGRKRKQVVEEEEPQPIDMPAQVCTRLLRIHFEMTHDCF